MALKARGAVLMYSPGLFSAQRWAALMTGDGTGEQSGDGYARTALTSATMAVANATGIAANNATIDFPNPTAAWQDSTWCAIYSAQSSGNILYTVAMANNPAAPQLGAPTGFDTGELRVVPNADLGKLTLEGWKLCLKGGLLNGNRYLGLHDAAPGTNRANELSGGAYVAQLVNLSNWTISTTNGNAVLNAKVTWPTMTVDQPDVTHLSLCDSASGGNVLWATALTNNPADPNIGDQFSIAVNNLTITLPVS